MNVLVVGYGSMGKRHVANATALGLKPLYIELEDGRLQFMSASTHDPRCDMQHTNPAIDDGWL